MSVPRVTGREPIVAGTIIAPNVSTRRRSWHPRWPQLNTLRARLTLWYVAVHALVLIIFASSVYGAGTRNLRAEIDRLLADEAHQVINSMQLTDGPPQLQPGFTRLTSGTVVTLYDPSGQHLLAGEGVPGDKAPALLPASAADNNPPLARTVDAEGVGAWRVLLVPVDENGTRQGLLQVARSERDLQVALHNLLVSLAVILPGTLLIAGLGGIFLAGRALNPIDRVTRMAESISQDRDLSRRLGLPARSDEVGNLARTFDRMLGRLQSSFDRQVQFTADASHELRTPLAMLMAQIDVVMAQPRPAEDYLNVLRSVREDAQRMARLVNELLVLARADAGQEQLECEVLDLHALAEDVVEAMHPLAAQAGIKLECAAADRVTVTGDQMRLTQLLVNLIDNAIKYTPTGGCVDVATVCERDWVILRVSDTGVGIPAEHLGHIFERFYRVDRARTRGGGTGLGLSFCRWVAGAHGGRIDVDSSPGRGSTFSVCLPVA